MITIFDTTEHHEHKCGIYPEQIDDWQIAPSKVFSKSTETESSTYHFTEEEEKLHQVQKGYNVPDPKYKAWLSLIQL